MNSGSKVVLGALAGAVAGAVVAGLFTTDEGAEAMQNIADKGRDLAGNFADKFSDLKDTVVDKYETAKQGASDLIDQGISKVSGAAGNVAQK